MDKNEHKKEDDVPNGVKGWSWGAFFLTWIWGISNRVWISLLALIPIVNIFVAIFLGLKGRELAWKARQWSDLDTFNKYQRGWNTAGFITITLIIVVFVIYPNYNKYEKTKSANVHYYNYRKGNVYGYEAKASAANLEHGQLAKKLFLTRLLKDSNGSYSVSIFRNLGSQDYSVFSCKLPCHYATVTNYYDGESSNGGILPVKRGTIIWEVLKDAVDGKLTVSRNQEN